MKQFFLTIVRVILLAILFTILLAVGSGLSTPPELLRRMTPEQVSQSTVALPIASVLMTIMLVYLALRSRWHGWKLAGALFAIAYPLYAFLGGIELLLFPAVASQLPEGTVWGLLLSGLILTVPFSLVAVPILGKAKNENTQDRPPMPLVELAWKLAVGAALYVVIYFVFGYYIPWKTPGLPEFYGGTDPGTFTAHMANQLRMTPWLPFVQLARGLIFATIGAIIVRMHKGGIPETALATGLAFTVLMNASLIFPNTFMPPFVARAHAIELVSENVIYGMLLAGLMLWRPTDTKRAQSVDSPA